MIRTNYHTHTKRCNHAWGEDKEYVEAAIQAGFQVLGFSDHVPWYNENENPSIVRMQPGELDDYFTSLDNLRRAYRQDIQIHIGFECEYVPGLMEGQAKLLADYPVEYCILGEHFTHDKRRNIYCSHETTDEQELIRYVDVCIEGLSTGQYIYLAHPDVFHYIGDDAVYHREFLRLCRYMQAHGFPVEINLLGYVEGRHYPSARFLGIAQEAGCKAIIGCDAHVPDMLLKREQIAECEALAAQYGLPLCDAPLSRYLRGAEDMANE